MKKTTIFAVLALLLSLFTVSGLALAQEPVGDSTPVSVGGVTPTLWTDNPSCSDLGYDFGYKDDGAPFTGSVDVTGDGVDDISWESGDGLYLLWSSTIGIDAVIMKGGPNANVYWYDEGSGDSGLSTPAAGPDISHVEFCFDYELTASKTANATWYKTIDWTIQKDFDASYVGFAGDVFPHGYKVTVTKDETFGPYVVDGTITVNNPTPFAVDFSVTDSVGGTSATVDCDPNTEGDQSGGTLAANASVDCTYTANLGSNTNGTNTATITSNNSNVDGATASEDYAFGDPVLSAGSEPEDITVSDTNGQNWATSVGTFWEYSKNFECPTDESAYTDGVYIAAPWINTATINETSESDIATVNLTCYAPVVSKDVTPAWEQDFQWDIYKNVDNTTFSGNPGDGWVFNYDIDVVLTSYDELNFSASGTITVQNPDPDNPMTVGLTDAVNGFNGVITADDDCDFDGTNLTIPAGSTATCDYSVDMGDNQDANKDTLYTNTATATIGGGSFSGEATFKFNDVSPTLADGSEPASVNATDDNATPGDTGDDHSAGPFSGSTSDVITYQQDGTCPTNASAYTNGEYEVILTNIADIVETTDSDTETVTVKCYAPVVSKDVTPAWEQDFQWDIYKNVDNTTFSGNPGDGWVFNYDIDVVLTSYDELNFSASGTITVQNPDPDNAMTVGLTDAVNGFNGVISADADCDFDGTDLTIPANSTATCDYSVDMGDLLDGQQATEYTNTATATLGGGSFSGTASFTFGDVEPTLAAGSEPASVNATDDNATPGDTGDDHSAGPFSGSSSDVITYQQGGTCPTDASAYTDGEYEVILTNIADIVETTDSDTETVTVKCYAGFVELLKLLNGSDTYDTVFTFGLYTGGPGGTQIADDATPPALMDFGGPALRLDTEYTICELNVPAGWGTIWTTTIADIYDSVTGIVIPYNPDANGIPPADVGTRCFDFSPDTAGQTYSFTIDNKYPAGNPRTPGYWKNWNRCTSGGQADNADRNGGWEEGFWLLEDVLDPNIGGGISWGDFEITECTDAVSILDARDIESGKKKANDAAYTLARALLAAQLNFGAGACTTQEALDAALAAETLLANLGFDGTGNYLRPKDSDYGYALELYEYLDAYNNGEFCGDTIE